MSVARAVQIVALLLTPVSWAPGQPVAPALPPAQTRPAEASQAPGSTDGVPAPAVGRLLIQAVQGTPGGPPMGGKPVEVMLVHQGAVVESIKDRQLDDVGALQLDDLALNLPVIPVVMIKHAGVTYQQTGTMMDAAHPEQTIEVVCYEVTNDVPPWTIQMRHVMVSHAPGGVRVTDVLLIDNPADRTWLGTPRAGGKPTTTSVAVPPRARDFSLGKGFHDWCCTSVADGRLVNHLPLMPDQTELNFSYTVPVEDDAAEVEIVAPVAMDHLMIMVPDDIESQAVDGAQLGGREKVADTVIRFYTASDLAAGNAVRVSLAGLTATASAGGASGGSMGMSGVAKVVAAVGGGALLLGVLVLLIKPARRSSPEGAES